MVRMGRIRRVASTALAIGALITLFAYSATFTAAYSFHEPAGMFVVVATRGMVHVQVWSPPTPAAPKPFTDSWRVSETRGRLLWMPRYQTVGDWLVVSVPLWLPAGCVAALLALRTVERWRRRRSGECAACGYSLAGLAAVDGRVKCPECGLASKEVLGGEPGAVPRRWAWRWGRYRAASAALVVVCVLGGVWLSVSVIVTAARSREEGRIAWTNVALDQILEVVELGEAMGRYESDAGAVSVVYPNALLLGNPGSDAWGTPFWYFPWTEKSPHSVVLSAGPDGVFNTSDDLYRRTPVTAGPDSQEAKERRRLQWGGHFY